MSNDSSSYPSYYAETFIVANTVIEKPYQRPLTATERLAKERADKRRRRAIKNRRRFL